MPDDVPRRGSISAPSEDRPHDAAAASARWRIGSWIRALVGSLFVVFLAGLVAFGARHIATHSDRFALEHLEVEGATRFGEAQLLSLMGVRLGDNLFAMDMGAVQRRLLEHPWLESADLQRKLPSTLRLRLVEREARALAALGDRLYLVTREGRPIIRYELAERGAFPIITGVSLEDLSADRARAEERLARGVEMLSTYERSQLAQTHPAQSLHLDADGSVELVVGDSGVTLVFGKGPIEQKLLMAARVLAKVRAKGELPQVVFLDNQAHPERVVVRLR